MALFFCPSFEFDCFLCLGSCFEGWIVFFFLLFFVG